MTGMTVFLFTQ